MIYRQAKLSNYLQRIQLFFFLTLLGFSGFSLKAQDSNSSTKIPSPEILRVISPGIFDVKYGDFQIRMRVWGVNFPQRGQPGFQESITFAENELISNRSLILVKKSFDEKNLKVVDVMTGERSESFSKKAISNGIGWHNEKETKRYGPYLLAQLKAKREKSGIWANNFNYQVLSPTLEKPKPKLPSALQYGNQLLPQISYWVTSFGRIHRPGCSFYERGRGTLSSNPQGEDCRICGGKKGKR